MEERGNKTIMCSVMFLDIVAYSKKSVSAQIAQKELFNSILANAISHVPANDRVILDTGDGAAITFLGDVEDALKAVLTFRDGLLNEGAKMDPPLQVCMAINLGPVRLVKDINDRPNIVGDGINVAQRVMGFAKPGQILVSRSYFDAASRLSQEYTGLFRSEGTRADKHDRVHEIYSIGIPGESAGTQKVGEDTLGLALKYSAIGNVTGKLQRAIAVFNDAPPQQRALYAGIAASALALLIVISVKIAHRTGAPAPEATEQSQAAPSAGISTTSAVPEMPVAMAGADAKKPASEAAAASPQKDEPAEEKKSKTSHHTDKHAEKKKDSSHTSATTAPSAKSAMSVVSVTVIPWGEVYLDGKQQGVSPPLDTLHVTPGKHDIEIRNTTFPPYTLSVDVKAGEQLKIKHKFGN